MSQLPKIHWVEDPNREKLALWFGIRDADLSLRRSRVAGEVPEKEAIGDSGSSLHVVASPVVDPVPISEYDFDVSVGEIRLLAPRLCPLAERPIYVAVFREWEDGMIILAPYSPYSIAATRTELEFRDRMHPLRVVCPWNSLTVHPFSLSESWKIDVLSPDEMKDIWHVFRHSATGHSLPEYLNSRIGCPIRRPHDPRIAYQDEEAGTLQLLAAINRPQELSEDAPELGKCIPITEIPLNSFHTQALPLAALTRSPESSKGEEFQIAGLSSYICFYRSSIQNEVLLVVYEPDGEPSRQLDFSVVYGGENVRLATIHGGMARWKTDRMAENVKIILPSGQSLKVFKKSNS